MPQSDISRLLLEAIRYEHWLRFYFLDDPENLDDLPSAAEEERGNADGMSAELRVPDEAAETSRLGEPHLYPLLGALQGKSISLESSRDAVFRHVALAAGGDPDDPAFGERLFQLVGDPEFRRGLDSFHGWVQELADGEAVWDDTPPETGEGSSVPSFARWQAAFEAWAAREAVQHVTTISPFGVKVAFGSEQGGGASAGDPDKSC